MNYIAISAPIDIFIHKKLAFIFFHAIMGTQTNQRGNKMSNQEKTLGYAVDLANQVCGLSEILREHLTNSEDNGQIDCIPGTNLSFSYSLMAKLCNEISEIIAEHTP